MKHFLLWVMSSLWLLCTACAPSAPLTPAHVPTPRTCGPFRVPDQAYLACAMQDSGLLLQTEAGQTVALTTAATTWTLAGTGLYVARESALTETLVTLEGTALVSVNGSTRIVPAGAQVILSRDDTGAVRSVSPQPLPYDTALLDGRLLAQLPRPLGLPTAIARPDSASAAVLPDTTTRIGVATVPAVCTVQEEWDEARVQAGENLSAIARRYGLTAADLQAANCLNNPNQLQIGQILRVPPLPTATPYAYPTLTPSVVAFRADSTTLAAGECTTLRWDVQNVSSLSLDEQPVTDSGVMPICPAATTTYTLRVVYPDGTQTQHPLVVNVE